MNSIVIFFEKESHLKSWSSLVNQYITEDGRFVIETSNGWLSIYQPNDIWRDYDEDELLVVKSLILEPIPYLIEWRDNSLLQEFIDNFPTDSHAVIDNDHGLICKISDIKDTPISRWLDAKQL
ncbi:hypothetical protein [Thiofilum flexile]|uniref:hypothetical protein n=1 Tax=Thiofilum flexile TaxID=125627 RepID=UPI00036E21B0|nr:hypothetical protein [Thiofilum flexile]